MGFIPHVVGFQGIPLCAYNTSTIMTRSTRLDLNSHTGKMLDVEQSSFNVLCAHVLPISKLHSFMAEISRMKNLCCLFDSVVKNMNKFHKTLNIRMTGVCICEWNNHNVITISSLFFFLQLSAQTTQEEMKTDDMTSMRYVHVIMTKIISNQLEILMKPDIATRQNEHNIH